MATIGWRDHRTLKEHLLRRYGDFNVFQLMRLLLAEPASALPMAQRLRFRADLSSAFPAREFSHLALRTRAGPDAASTQASTQTAADEVVEITSANFCVASILGPLPEPFTEWVRDLSRARQPAMADFLDMFNQRLNILRFELKQAQEIGLNSLPPADTALAKDLAALMGLGAPLVAQQVPLPPRAWLALAGLLANRRKSASTVAHVLRLALNASVTLLPMTGGWQTIEPPDRMALGRRNGQLGQRSVLGRRVWDQQARIGLVIETLDYDAMCRLLPPSPSSSPSAGAETETETAASDFSRFTSLLQLLLDRLVDFEVELRVDAASIPPARLAAATAPMRLGQTAWLHQPRASGDNHHNKIGPQRKVRNVRYVIFANPHNAARAA
jgi:type VI secretion system protein ImpH